jgi:hypothetical protein
MGRVRFHDPFWKPHPIYTYVTSFTEQRMRVNQAGAVVMTAKEVHVPDSFDAVLAAKRLFHLAAL